MQVLLTTDYPELGQKGDVVNVKPGHFRNFLMPKGIVRMATAADVEKHEAMEAKRLEQRQEMMAQAAQMTSKLDGQKITLKEKASESGSLYSQVHEMEVVKELNDKFGCAVQESDVKFEQPVKKVGEYKFTVRLTTDHQAELTLVVEAADAE